MLPDIISPMTHDGTLTRGGLPYKVRTVLRSATVCVEQYTLAGLRAPSLVRRRQYRRQASFLPFSRRLVCVAFATTPLSKLHIRTSDISQLANVWTALELVRVSGTIR